MLEKGFNSWRGPRKGASGSAVGQLSKSMQAKGLVLQGWTRGEMSLSRKVDLMIKSGGHGFCLKTVGTTIGLCALHWCVFQSGLKYVGRQGLN